MLTLVLVALMGVACGRSPLLEPDDQRRTDAAVVIDRPAERAPDVAPDLGPDTRDTPPEMAPDRPADRRDAADAAAVDTGPVCLPQAEVCNGVDDDCDGTVDENQAPIPCPAGGYRYCVAGRFSECPRRCDVCVPGSTRICYLSFCVFWGTQACAADGRSFGPCKEAQPPRECEDVAKQRKKSPELEQCCLDNDYCCLDEFDLDHDGDHGEMLGRCEAVTCGP